MPAAAGTPCTIIEFLHPELLADRQHVPVVEIGGDRAAKRAAQADDAVFCLDPDGLLEGVALDVLDHASSDRGSSGMIQPAGPGCDHGVVHLPVLVAHRRRRRAGVVEEDVARRLLRLAFEVVALVDAVERGLDDAGILAGLDLLLQLVALGAAGDVDQRRQPVEGREHWFLTVPGLMCPGQRTTSGAR